MQNISLHGKAFKPYLSEQEIKNRVRQVAAQISHDYRGRCPLMLAVLNGAFVFAADLLRDLQTPCEIAFVRMQSYVGTSSTGRVKQLLGLTQDIEGRDVVIVEDIIDSGLTMKELLSTLSAKHPASLAVSALLVKPDNLRVDLDISYRCFDIPSDFIVGYGLDYDGLGRELRDIWVAE